MVKKYILLIFLLIFINSLIVYAADNSSTTKTIDKEKAFAWLNNESKKESWGGNTEITAWIVLALKNDRNSDYQKALKKLKDSEDDSNWNDDIYETSMATIALKKTGNNVDDEMEWLFDKQEKVLESGSWFIQFLTDSEEANCKILYDNEEKEFTINKTEIVDSSESCDSVGQNWVDFEDCIKDDDADLYEQFEVECLSNSKVQTSVLFKNNANYYIVDQNTPLEIENACFYADNNDCSCLGTQYASWALSVINDPEYRAYTIPYLRSSCNENVLDNIFLYMLTSSNEYYNYLASDKGQLNDGSFDGDEYKTALALIAMRGKNTPEVTKAVNWLAYKQKEDGSWDGSIKKTAVVLYALTADIPITRINETNQTGCGNRILDNATEQCEFTSQCNNSSMTCNTACMCVAKQGCTRNEGCTTVGYVCQNGVCGPEEECTVNLDCDSGYVCIQKKCILQQVSECKTDIDCADGFVCENESCVEQGSSWVTWLIVSLIIVVGLIGAYFGYKKFFKKKGGAKSTGFKPNTPFTPRGSYPQTRQNVPVNREPVAHSEGIDRVEEQLDQSLKKARDLLRGK